METMKAIRIHSYGGPDKLFLEEVPRPEPAAREVLIKVHAAGVNPIDWKVREGMLQAWLPHRLPVTPGWDVSGVMAAIGKRDYGLPDQMTPCMACWISCGTARMPSTWLPKPGTWPQANLRGARACRRRAHCRTDRLAGAVRSGRSCRGRDHSHSRSAGRGSGTLQCNWRNGKAHG